jgi:hypothetical protein
LNNVCRVHTNRKELGIPIGSIDKIHEKNGDPQRKSHKDWALGAEYPNKTEKRGVISVYQRIDRITKDWNY